MRAYHDAYSWRYPIDNHVIGGHDGSVSIAIPWDGFHFEMMLPEDRRDFMNRILQVLKSIDPTWFVENHLFRFYDDSLARDYVAYADKAVRCRALARQVRTAAAETLAQFGMTNKVVTVVTARVGTRGGFTRPKREFRKQEQAAIQLKREIRPFLERFPGARLATVDEFGEFIARTNDLDLARQGAFRSFDRRWHLNEQWCQAKPEWDDGFLRVGQTLHWVALVDMYPDEVYDGWIEFIADLPGAEFHIVQVLQLADSRKSVQSAERTERQESQSLGSRGGTFLRAKVRDVASYKNYIADNQLPVFKNVYILTVSHTDREQLSQLTKNLTDYMSQSGARVRDAQNIQFAAWRYSHPGQGYQTAYLREDAGDLVVAMAPVNTHHRGEGIPVMLRLTAQGELVALHYPEGAANHGFTAGKTRSGKGAEKVMRILENYPLGMDQYIIEYGGSYRWVVRALGGTYINIDPDKTVINPLPPFEEVEATKVAGRVAASIASMTVSSLAPILTGGPVSFDKVPDGNHHDSRAERAFRALYEHYDPDVDEETSPTLQDLCDVIEFLRDSAETDQDRKSYGFLYENLNSFLSTAVGQRFTHSEDNIDLSGTCIGVDIKPLVSTNNKQLLTVYLLSIFLRLEHKVLANKNAAELAIDELHMPARLAPELTYTLVDVAVRTWAKENGQVEALSQRPEEFKGSEDTISDMSYTQWMYMKQGHDKTQEIFNIPERAAAAWKAYPEPSTAQLPYRQGIRQHGERTYDFRFILPEIVLDLADTSPSALAIKDEIETSHPDATIWEWLELFNQRKRQRPEEPVEEEEAL